MPSDLAVTSVQSTSGSPRLPWEGCTDTRKERPNRCPKLLWIRGRTNCICLRTNGSCNSKDVVPAILKSFVIYEHKCTVTVGT